MKNVFLILPLCITFGCGEAEGPNDPRLTKGTDVGVQSCVRKNVENISPKPAIQKACIKLHEKPLATSIDGRGSYELRDGAVYFSGYLTNNGTTSIITSFEVTVRHNEMSQGQLERKVIVGEWIGPNNALSFTIGPDEMILPPDAARLMSGNQNFYSWDMTNIKGVDIKTY